MKKWCQLVGEFDYLKFHQMVENIQYFYNMSSFPNHQTDVKQSG